MGVIENDYEAVDIYFHFTTTFLGPLPPAQQPLTPSVLPATDLGILLSGPNKADTNTADPTHIALFNSMLHDTNSPALVLQALIARGTQANYFKHLLREDRTAFASATFSNTGLFPVRWNGFVAAVSILMVHLITLAIVTLLFIRYTRNSMIGNSWQAVAQVILEDTLPVLGQACQKKGVEIQDREMNQIAHHSSLRYWANGRVAVGIGGKERLE